MPDLAYYIFTFLFGYLIGSFPTAYLLVKRHARIDIRNSGSGNAGAMNAFDVTRSKLLAVSVLIVDLVKGVAAAFVGPAFFSNGFWMMGIGGLGAIIGHNYSPWLRFQGGRGLATGAGVLLVIAWIAVVIWCAAWGIVYSYSKNIHIANVIALIVTPLIVWLAPENFLRLVLMPSVGRANLIVFTTILFSLILLRHAKLVADLWKSSH